MSGTAPFIFFEAINPIGQGHRFVPRTATPEARRRAEAEFQRALDRTIRILREEAPNTAYSARVLDIGKPIIEDFGTELESDSPEGALVLRGDVFFRPSSQKSTRVYRWIIGGTKAHRIYSRKIKLFRSKRIADLPLSNRRIRLYARQRINRGNRLRIPIGNGRYMFPYEVTVRGTAPDMFSQRAAVRANKEIEPQLRLRFSEAFVDEVERTLYGGKFG